MDNSEDFRVDIPLSYRANLEAWGIEEVEPGVCVNNYENRTIIRNNKARYQPIYQADGAETDLIQVLTAEMLEARARLTKTDLLTDFRDIDSDYMTGLELIMVIGVDDIVPLWVLAATRAYREIEKKRATDPGHRPKLISYPGRCRAKRTDGKRCMMWHGGRMDEDGLCKMHIATHTNDETFGANMLTKARNRLYSASVAATEVLEELMANATSEPVRAQAAKEILDRSGVRAGMEIEIKGEIDVKPARDMIAERLEMLALAAKQDEIEAEVIEDE